MICWLRARKRKSIWTVCFWSSSGKFLGFMVSHRGIEENLDKIQAILEMEKSRNIKEV